MKKGALCLFLITIKAPQSLLTPSPEITPERREGSHHRGQRESPARVVDAIKGKTKIYRARTDVRWGWEISSMITSSEIG